MTSIEAYQAIAISLGLGLLIGFQREWKASEIAGIRTFPLITMFGTIIVLMGEQHRSLLAAAGLIALAVLLAIANVAKMRARELEFGLTTEVAVLLMFSVGCLVGAGFVEPAIVTTGVAAVLLHWKDRLHGMVAAFSANDLRAVMNLALIGLIILPILPNETYGPYNVLNPYDIWRMVVLIVGISMVAYVAYRLLGAKIGAVLGGILGGFISSTATTVSYARLTKDIPHLSSLASLVIMIASAIVNVRIIIEIGVVSPRLLQVAFLPMALMLLLMAAECVVLYLPLHKRDTQAPGHDNPAQLKPAIIFGILYALVLFVVAAAKDLFGNQALYWVAAISGLTDVDAITLSTAKLFNQQSIDGDTAWRVILLASMSNLLFKAGAVAVLGSRQLLLYVAAAFGIALTGGGLLLAFWPGIEVSAIHSSIHG